MKTNILKLFICAVLMTSFTAIRAATIIDSTYTGPIGGNWSDPANWSPQIVPNNSADQKFDVSVASELPGVTLDIKVKLRSLTLTDEFSTVFLLDHSLSSDATSVAVNFPDEFLGGGFVFLQAQTTDVAAHLGKLADFSGDTLNTGNYVAYVPHASLGRKATIQFDGADIETNRADIQLAGKGTSIVDENGNDALRHFRKNKGPAIFDIETGRDFTTSGSLINEGEVHVFASFPPDDVDTTLTISGDYTGIGFPLDPVHPLGLPILLAAGPVGDARMIINGKITNYDPATQTLHRSYWAWAAARGRSAITKVLGGGKPLDIVKSEAALILTGPNTGFRDKFGNDALRNLSVSARLIIGDRNFTTANDFTSTSRLSIFGDTRFTVSGHLTIRSGFFEVSPLTDYAREGDPGFPTSPAYLSSQVIVRGNFNLQSQGILRFHILNKAKTATVLVKGAAVFAGSLGAGVEDISKVDADDNFAVLTADKITGQFSNVASGGRVNVYGAFDQFGTPMGDPVGTFRVTYSDTSLVFGNFRRK